MADLYGTNNDRSFSSSSSLESEDMSSFLQTFLNNPSTKGNSFYSSEANQVQKQSEGRQNSNPPRSSKRTRAAEIHNLSEKRRRSRINEKLKALQTLVPNSNKTDKASMLDEAIEYLKQLQLKVQTLTMRNGFGLPPIYSQEQEMQRGMIYNEGLRLPNPSEIGATFTQNQDFSIRREFDIPNHIGMPTLTNIMKPEIVFGSELTNENHYGFTNMKEIGHNGGKMPSPGVSL
ncbi:unnamed protein product [Lactuca saligna]|uniref:BHLH domain-containing protein n=1 Tax=Lactuca saligna TaxID=75948 RepID=A0AA35YXY2_LACSI|nr:unnamed protein product [Lactuca saligna]